MNSNTSYGAVYTPVKTTFTVWAPVHEKVELLLYANANTIYRETYEMTKSGDGNFSIEIDNDLDGFFYNYKINESEITDPFSVSCCGNSKRSAIIDLTKSNPEGWNKHSIPKTIPFTDSVLYELHVKDFSSSETSGIANKGKFIGLTEKNTSYGNVSTGLDHLVDLGITHVHLMPINDYISVDEYNDKSYNWGYDPEHYNVPEGSYSSNPDDGYSRVRELKETIMKFHEAGIRVIIDVVYNHTFKGGDFNLNVLAPNEFYRFNDDGSYSNGSGCGNEVASENKFTQFFILNSLVHWAKEYKVDGFRFDLLGLMDVDTTHKIVSMLNKDYPHIKIYGEPWIGGSSALPHDKQTLKGSQFGKNYSLFNDDFRNAIKGDNDGNTKGYIQGSSKDIEDIKIGISGSIQFCENLKGFCCHPVETINYFNAHDNLIMADKLIKSSSNHSKNHQISLNKFAMSLLLTSQGVPFFHAGNEFMRSKNMNHNSYNAPVEVNQIDWYYKTSNIELNNYVIELISLRKQYPHFRLASEKEIRDALTFIDPNSVVDKSFSGTIAFEIEKDSETLLVVHNNSCESLSLKDGAFERCLFNSIGFSSENRIDAYSTSVYKL